MSSISDKLEVSRMIDNVNFGLEYCKLGVLDDTTITLLQDGVMILDEIISRDGVIAIGDIEHHVEVEALERAKWSLIGIIDRRSKPNFKPSLDLCRNLQKLFLVIGSFYMSFILDKFREIEHRDDALMDVMRAF